MHHWVDAAALSIAIAVLFWATFGLLYYLDKQDSSRG